MNFDPKSHWYSKILCLIFILNTHFLYAQRPEVISFAFRIYTPEGKFISPAEFEKQVELYSLYIEPQYINRKKLIFDDRTNYYLLQEEKLEAPTQFLFVYKGEVSTITFQHTSNNITIDHLTLEGGQYHIKMADFTIVEGNVSIYEKKTNLVLYKDQLEKYKQAEALPMPDPEEFGERIRLVNSAQILSREK